MHFAAAPKLLASLCISGALLTSACTTTGSQSSGFCTNNQAACIAIGVVIAGGIIASGNSGGTAPPVFSDERLKTDIQPLYTLESGLNVYAYRYLGSEEVFAGVMAQELLLDERYAHAVTTTEDGFYAVNYATLPVRLANFEAMQNASKAAIAMF